MNSFLEITLFGSATAFLIALAVLVIALLKLEYDQEGSGMTVLLVIFILLYTLCSGKNDPEIYDALTVKNVIIYICLGFIYSLVRTYFFGKRTKGNETYSKSILADKVFRWLSYWPISLLVWLFTDLMGDLFEICWKKVSGLYFYIYNLSTKDSE